MKLYFENSRGNIREIAEVATYQEASRKMSNFMNDHNYACYYTRMWGVEREDIGICLKFDVGSWSEFFYVAFDSEEERERFIKRG